MHLLPRGRVVIESPLVIDACISALRANLRAPTIADSFRAPSRAKPLKGEVEGTRFKLSRNRSLLWRNSFEPIFEGSIEGDAERCRMKGVVRMSRSTAAFMTAWLGIVGLVSLVSVVAAVIGSDERATTGIVLLLPCSRLDTRSACGGSGAAFRC